MQTVDVTPTELQQAKAILLRQLPLSESSEDAVAEGLLADSLAGLPLDERHHAATIYAKLSAGQVRAAFKKYIRPAAFRANRPRSEPVLISGAPIVWVKRGSRVESVHAVAALRGRSARTCRVCVRCDRRPRLLALGRKAVHHGGNRRVGGGPIVSGSTIANSPSSARRITASPFTWRPSRASLRRSASTRRLCVCGASAPAYEPAAAALSEAGVKPTAIHNNCSGKHAGILAMCVHAGYPLETYLDFEASRAAAYPRVLRAHERRRPGAWDIGVDGCGIPVYATTPTARRHGVRAFRDPRGRVRHGRSRARTRAHRDDRRARIRGRNRTLR